MYVIRVKERYKPFLRAQATYYAGMNRFSQIVSYPAMTRYILHFNSRQEANATRAYLLENVRFYGVGIGHKYALRVVNEKRVPRI